MTYIPCIAEDLVLLIRVGVRLEEVDHLPDQGLLLRELLRIVPMFGRGSIRLKQNKMFLS